MPVGDFNPYSKEQQAGPKKAKGKPARDKKKPNGYAEATERARNLVGVIHCERCEKQMPDERVQRHHIVFRSRGGGNEAENLKVVCLSCHQAEHGLGRS